MRTTAAQMLNSGVCFAVITRQEKVFWSGMVAIMVALIFGYMLGCLTGYAMAKQRQEKEKLKASEDEIKKLKDELANYKNQNK